MSERNPSTSLDDIPDEAWPFPFPRSDWEQVPPSVQAFHLTLLRRIETERAAYATVLFPIVALTLSTMFEGYQWTAAVFIGVILTLLGNVFVLMQPRAAKMQ